MGYWRKHPKKDLEAVLVIFHINAWEIKSTRGYYKLLCPCGEHWRSFHLSPSNANYGKDALKWGQRQPCWKGAT